MEEALSLPPDWRPRFGYYLTIDWSAKHGAYISVISDGTPQKGHSPVLVLDVEVCKTRKAAKAWFHKACEEQPWMPRQ